jgi:hypothetical protein
MPDSVNYPDLLGLITGGNRSNVGAAQVALAARPHIVRAGRPFEVILLVQNCIDIDIDVTMALHLPGADAKKQRERFITKNQRLVVGVKGAEVGYVVLPVTTLPDTAISGGYKIGVEVEVKPRGKSSRVRLAEGGGEVQLDRLRDDTRALIDDLKTLAFTTSRHFGRNLFDVPLTVMSGTLGKMTDFTPGWVSVCKLSDYHDFRLMLHRYGPLVQISALPKLKRGVLFKPLLEATTARFSEAGYPLKDAEAEAIARLMTLVLEYATPRFNAHGNVAARSFDVEALLLRDPFTFDEQPVFPHWFRSFLATVERDERAVSYPAQVISRYLYLDLLRDAVDFSFDLVTEATGEDLGSAEERATYREQLVTLLGEKSGLDFNRVYLPLVMGGVLINDQLVIDKENPAELLRAVGMALEERSADLHEPDRALHSMINTIIGRAGQRYGFYVGK